MQARAVLPAANQGILRLSGSASNALVGAVVVMVSVADSALAPTMLTGEEVPKLRVGK
jgi:hypothetical protein